MWNPFEKRTPVEKAKRGGKLTAEEWRAVSFIDGYWPDYSEPTNQYGHVSVSRALSLVPVFGATRLLADTISSLPLMLLQRDKRGIPKRQPTPSLFNNPSVHGTTVDWVQRAVVSMALQGDAIGLITRRDFYNFPTMMEWLNPEQVATQDGKLEGPGSFVNPIWWWWGRPLNPQNILHIPWFTMPWRVRGLSPIGAYQLTTNVGIGAEEYAANWYANGGVPPGTFQNSEKTFEDKDADQITNRLVARLQARKPLVYGKDWTYNPIAIKPNEAEFINTMRLTATQIAVIYGIPPEKIGGTTGASLTYCADTETEILTLRGWLRYDEVTVEDTCLTLNTSTGMAEWQPVRAVNVFDGPHEVIKMENTSHSSVTTPNHRWPVTFRTSYEPRGRPRGWSADTPKNQRRVSGFNWRTTGAFSGEARICAAAPVVAPIEAKWSDALVELIAWFWTEGYVSNNHPNSCQCGCYKHGSVVLTQSSVVNLANVLRIRAALAETFGPSSKKLQGLARPAWREFTEPRGITRFWLNKKASEVLIVHAPKKVVSTEFLSQLTRAQLELFIQTSIDADGWWRKDRSGAVIAQKDRARLDAFQVACTLAGKSGQVRQQKSGMWCMSIASNPWRKPANHSKDVEHLVIDGPVWCPTTANKTWFARRNGTVYATGNSTVEMNTLDYLTFSIRPWLTKLEAALSNCFPRGYYVRFDTREMLRLDAQTQADVDQKSLGSSVAPGWRQVDEVRADHDWGPMPKAPAAPTDVVPQPPRPADGDPNNIDVNPDDYDATNGLGGWTEEPNVKAADKIDVIKPDIKKGVKRSANGQTTFGPAARVKLLAKRSDWRDRMVNGSDPVATKGNSI